MKIFILSLCFFSFAFGDSFYKAKRQLLEYFEKNPKEAKTLYNKQINLIYFKKYNLYNY